MHLAELKAAATALAIAAFSVAAASPAAAQETPKEIATAFFTAITEERWRDAARAMDLLAFDRYRRERIAAARLPQPPVRRMTVEEYLRHEPDMPRAVAEYQVRKINEARHEPSHWLLREFAGVPNIDSLAALSAEEAAARWLQAEDLRWQLRQSYEQQRARGCPLPADAQHPQPPPKFRVLGALVIDSTTAYVLHEDTEFRRAEPDVDAAMYAMLPSILTLRRRGDRWKILARQTMLRGPGAVAFVSVLCLPAGQPRPPR